MEDVVYTCGLVSKLFVLSCVLTIVLYCLFTGGVFSLWCMVVPLDP